MGGGRDAILEPKALQAEAGEVVTVVVREGVDHWGGEGWLGIEVVVGEGPSGQPHD